MPSSVGASALLQRLPIFLAACLLLLTCIALAWQTQGLLHLLHTSPRSESSTADVHSTPPAIDQIAALFGPSSSQGQPLTTLNLTLHGSFMHSDPAKSSIIVQLPGSPPQRYLTGAELNQNTRVHRIYAHYVELERNGVIERLNFPSSQRNHTHNPSTTPLDDSVGDDRVVDEALHKQRMEELRQQMEAAMLEASNPTESPED